MGDGRASIEGPSIEGVRGPTSDTERRFFQPITGCRPEVGESIFPSPIKPMFTSNFKKPLRFEESCRRTPFVGSNTFSGPVWRVEKHGVPDNMAESGE